MCNSIILSFKLCASHQIDVFIFSLNTQTRRIPFLIGFYSGRNFSQQFFWSGKFCILAADFRPLGLEYLNKPSKSFMKSY